MRRSNLYLFMAENAAHNLLTRSYQEHTAIVLTAVRCSVAKTPARGLQPACVKRAPQLKCTSYTPLSGSTISGGLYSILVVKTTPLSPLETLFWPLRKIRLPGTPALDGLPRRLYGYIKGPFFFCPKEGTVLYLCTHLSHPKRSQENGKKRLEKL